MYEVRLSGSYYDMGVKMGKMGFRDECCEKKVLDKVVHTKQGKLRYSVIIDVLKSHEEKMCTHDYDKKVKVNYGICWSWILSPGKNEAAICAGPPCKNKFREFDFHQNIDSNSL